MALVCSALDASVPPAWSSDAADAVDTLVSAPSLAGGLHLTLARNLLKIIADVNRRAECVGDDPLMRRPRELRRLTVHLEPAARERLDDVVRDARRIRFLTSRTKQHDFRRAVCMLALYSIDETRTTRDLPLQALHITAGYALLRMLAQVPDDPVDDESAHA